MVPAASLAGLATGSQQRDESELDAKCVADPFLVSAACMVPFYLVQYLSLALSRAVPSRLLSVRHGERKPEAL